MSQVQIDSEVAVRITRTFSAPRNKVFAAWTRPELLQQWFHPSDDWTTPVHEIDLREGGAYRLGMQSPDGKEMHVACGTFREISSPEKLVMTWNWEGDPLQETLLTLRFHERGDATELELVHELFPDSKSRDSHNEGWQGCLAQLQKVV